MSLRWTLYVVPNPPKGPQICKVSKIWTVIRDNFETVGYQLILITNRKSHAGFWLVPTSVSLNDLERRNSPYFAFFLPNSIALQADYVTVVEARPIMSAKYRFPVPVFHFRPKLTQRAAQSLCDSWATCLPLNVCKISFPVGMGPSHPRPIPAHLIRKPAPCRAVDTTALLTMTLTTGWFRKKYFNTKIAISQTYVKILAPTFVHLFRTKLRLCMLLRALFTSLTTKWRKRKLQLRIS